MPQPNLPFTFQPMTVAVMPCATVQAEQDQQPATIAHLFLTITCLMQFICHLEGKMIESPVSLPPVLLHPQPPSFQRCIYVVPILGCHG
ncbi:hypothetical protein BDV35DRAFT_344065 [Aspergillus flavus]|uniref:Uncharacterized protein n=1 Tax=Aspergillus flavus TaxID=5059 RepID=A0A5N6H9G9_ASPFL|nr:hypothetical protein BDV35DRAFT_344065 [Aspergillus flavus]